jgi:hypothetical protein
MRQREKASSAPLYTGSLRRLRFPEHNGYLQQLQGSISGGKRQQLSTATAGLNQWRKAQRLSVPKEDNIVKL